MLLLLLVAIFIAIVVLVLKGRGVVKGNVCVELSTNDVKAVFNLFIVDWKRKKWGGEEKKKAQINSSDSWYPFQPCRLLTKHS